MKTLNGLMKHLRDKGIETHGSVHKRKMKNYGYYHGYKRGTVLWAILPTAWV